MNFYVKLAWNDLYDRPFSPVRDRNLIRKETGLDVSDRHEFEEKFGRNYTAPTCHQLWTRPRINFDGRVLGCSIDHWGDFGNIFSNGGLESCLGSTKMQNTREMLMGLRGPDPESPCLNCDIYTGMVRTYAWVQPQDLVAPPVQTPGARLSLPRRALRRALRVYRSRMVPR